MQSAPRMALDLLSLAADSATILQRMRSEMRVDLLHIDVLKNAISAHMWCFNHEIIVHPAMIGSQRNVE